MFEEYVAPHVFVVFGATGDLMRRKLLPALYHLANEGHLGEKFKIVGIAQNDFDDEAYRAWAKEALQDARLRESSNVNEWCDQCLHYLPVGDGGPEVFKSIAAYLDKLEADHDLPGNRTFYLALPPRVFAPTIRGLGNAGLNKSAGHVRLVIEKPFGKNLASAHKLNEVLHEHFVESQVYRIDHYLGKETVQNLLVFRFANPVFESLWNRDRVESVEITVAESLGVEKRAGYYDQSGALRDMVQNHLMQLLTLTAMEVPAAFEADAIRDEKVKVLKSIAPLDPEKIIIGQYAEGHVNDKKVPGYLDEEGVPDGSTTETFVALEVQIDSWRWQGVPFYLRTGKRMDERLTKIVVNFRTAPVSLFPKHRNSRLSPNRLILTLQPNEGFELGFEVKSPGQEMTTQTQRLHFEYGEAFGPLQDGYETLLFDVITNDQTLFVRADEVEMSWGLYEPLLNDTHPVYSYESGSWGPQEAHFMLAKSGHRWFEK
ncbi:MAG: glucose-6-phosphate dehydrogenase [Rhodothermales bacterium]